jgi:tetratricopeptide (TPR) repeat protein
VRYSVHSSGRRTASAGIPGLEPAADAFISKYLPTSRVVAEIATGVTATLPFTRDGIGLLLAEVHQALRDDEAAIHVVEQVEPTADAAVSLAELYTKTGRYEDVIELTEGIANHDEATALLCIFRGIAFREQSYFDAAREVLKEALKTKQRDPFVRHRALLERARTYAAEGKKAQARKDLERIMAEDSDYDGLQEAMHDLGV